MVCQRYLVLCDGFLSIVHHLGDKIDIFFPAQVKIFYGIYLPEKAKQKT